MVEIWQSIGRPNRFGDGFDVVEVEMVGGHISSEIVEVISVDIRSIDSAQPGTNPQISRNGINYGQL